MVAVCGIGSGNMRATGNELDDGTEAACLADRRFVAEGGAGSAEGTSATGAEGVDVGDAVGTGRRLRQPRSPAGRARGEGGKTAEGNAGDERWREGEEVEGGRRGEKRSESRPSRGC